MGVSGARGPIKGRTFGSVTRRLWGWVDSAEVVSALFAPGQVIAGWPAVELRDLMRSMRDEAYTVLGLAEDLQLTEKRSLSHALHCCFGGVTRLVQPRNAR